MAKLNLSQEVLDNLWRVSPATLATHLSKQEHVPWYAPKHLELLSSKVVEVVAGRLPRLIVTMPPRHGKILGKQNLVLMGDGSRKHLGEIELGDEVITYRGRPRKVLEIFEQGWRDCLILTTKTGREVVTEPTHPFLNHDDNMVEARTLRVGDGLAINRNFELLQTDRHRLGEEFRLTGYLCGDGCCSVDCRLAVTDLEEFADAVQCGTSLGFNHRHRPEVGSLDFSEALPWLRNSGMLGKTAHDKIVPDWVFTAPNRLVAQFIGAYFATDGAVGSIHTMRTSGPRGGSPVGCAAEFCSVSKTLLEGVRHLLARFEILSNLRPKKGRYAGKVHWSWRLIITDRQSLSNFIDEIPVFHSVKRARLQEWREFLMTTADRRPRLTRQQLRTVLEEEGSYRGLAAQFGLGEHLVWDIKKGIYKDFALDENYIYDEIVSITNTRADCRCLTIEQDETFTVNDFVVHNSELVSHWVPVWFLENWPWKRVILGSYEADFAASWGRKARNTSQRYNEQGTKQLRVRLDMNTQAVSHWLTTEGGGMSTAGVGGPITGKGADLLIIDDPIKNWAEAGSYTIRNNTWDWYRSTARTRVEPGGGIIIAMTRWHPDDLVGRLIKSTDEEGGEPWEVFNFPAIAEDHDLLGRKPGQTLWPRRYPEKEMLAIKSSVGPKFWNAMYQQNPGKDDDVGNVYYSFEWDNVREMDYDPHRPLILALDFNINPMTGVICQDYPGFRSDLTTAFVLDELYLPNSNAQKLTHEFASRVFVLTGGHQTVVEIYGDASGRQKAASGDKSSWEVIKQTLQVYPFIIPQFKYKKANPTIKERVNTVNTALKSADNTRRLFVSAKCGELIQDFRKIAWAMDNDGNPSGAMDKSDSKRTHISDALGYYVADRFAFRTKGGGREGLMQ